MQSEANLNGHNGAADTNGVDLAGLDINEDTNKKSILDSQRAVTGVLTSRPTSRDIKIDGAHASPGSIICTSMIAMHGMKGGGANTLPRCSGVSGCNLCALITDGWCWRLQASA